MSERGEFIPLRDEGGGTYLDEVYVRGHVSDEEADAALQAWWGDYADDEDGLQPYDPWEHVYARWSQESTWDGPGMVLREYRERGRGRFPVTRARASWMRIRREERKAAEEKIRAAVVEKFGDDIVIVRGDAERVVFQFPAQAGTHRNVMWLMAEPDTALVPQMDHEAWKEWRGNDE